MLSRLAGISASRKARPPGRRIRNQWQRAAAPVVAGEMVSAAAPAGETIGSWRLVCPDAPPGLGCVLRHQDASLQAGGYSVAVEVQSVGGVLVPVVAVRGAAPQTAVGSLLTVVVGLRLDHGPWIALPCEPALRCLPSSDALATLARTFPAAETLRLRLEVTLPDGSSLPRPEHEFSLIGTKRAVERLKIAGAVTT